MTTDPPGAGALDEAAARELRRLWDELVPAPHELVERSEVSPATAALLSQVGLPRQDPLEVEYFHDDRLLRRTVVEGRTYHPVADDAGVLLAVRAGDDELWAVDPGGIITSRFVNSALDGFLVFRGLLAARLDAFTEEHTAAEAVTALRAEFAARDARAVEEPDSWWRLVLEQAQEGYL